MKARFRVVDFFCGGGGFSEGFRQAGFNVIRAFDNWQSAVDTHNENHPECTAIKEDIITISNLPDDEFDKLVPDSEIIIGSPPCTDFSNSNKSGNGDKSKGIQLIEAYLKIVARKKFKKNSILKYWILENVPKAGNFIRDKYTSKYFGLKSNSVLLTKTRGVYNAKYYGVPSNRVRLFCGDFPEPQKIISNEKDLILLKHVLESLGAPKQKLHSVIVDPLYKIKLKGEDVTDHHYFHLLAEHETEKIKRLKQDKGYMGKMAIPENPYRPARTIMATMSFSARECFVLGHVNGSLRAPTIREVATLMSFPIDYKFFGNSLGTKYRLVGNAVPPKMAYAFAKAIMPSRKANGNNSYVRINHPHKIGFTNLNLDEIPVKTEKPKKETARFKYHIPHFKFDTFRVELTNNASDFEKLKFNWKAEIHYNQGKDKARVYTPSLTKIKFDKSDIRRAEKFFTKGLKSKIVGFDEFQRIHCLTSSDIKKRGLVCPYGLLSLVRKFIDMEFNYQEQWGNLQINEPPNTLPVPIGIGYYILSRYVQLMKRRK